MHLYLIKSSFNNTWWHILAKPLKPLKPSNRAITEVPSSVSNDFSISLTWHGSNWLTSNVVFFLSIYMDCTNERLIWFPLSFRAVLIFVNSHQNFVLLVQFMSILPNIVIHFWSFSVVKIRSFISRHFFLVKSRQFPSIPVNSLQLILSYPFISCLTRLCIWRPYNVYTILSYMLI